MLAHLIVKVVNLLLMHTIKAAKTNLRGKLFVVVIDFKFKTGFGALSIF